MGVSQAQDIRATISDRVVAALESGVAPWHKAWSSSGGGLPRSLSTGKAYRGVNVFLLALSDYTSPFWGTYNAIAEKAGMVKNLRGRWESPDGTSRGVRAGEKGTQIIFWKRFPKDVINPETGQTEHKSFMIAKAFTVFNAEQADGLPVKFDPAQNDAEEVAEHPKASAVAKEYFGRDGAPSVRYGGDRACYGHSTDHIQLPNLADFESDEAFQSARFHEMAHSTGHVTRCNRPGVQGHDHYGSEKYAKEELVAEMTAAMLMATCGIESTFDNSAAYLGSWITAIRGDASLVVQAGAQAQRALDNILGVTFEDE